MLRKSRFVLFGFACMLSLCAAQEQSSPPSFAMVIDASLDPVEWKIEGQAKATIYNRSSSAVERVVFLLQPNAYADTDALARAGIAVSHEVLNNGARYLGYLDVRELSLSAPPEIDGTEMTVTLDEPLSPGGEVELSIRFVVKLPHRSLSVSGYIGQHVDASFWYPKPSGAGNFDVTLSLPDHFIIEATGHLEESHVENSIKKVRYTTQGAFDFVWTADPHYVPEKNLYKGVEIVLLSQPFMEEKAPSLLEAAKSCIDFAETFLSPSRHGKLIVAATPYGAGEEAAHTMFISIGQEFPSHLDCFAQHTREPEAQLLRTWARQYFLNFTGEEHPLSRSLSDYVFLKMLPSLGRGEISPSALSGLERKIVRRLLDNGFGLHPLRAEEGVCCAPYRSHLGWINITSFAGYRLSPFHPEVEKPTLMGYEMPRFHVSGAKAACSRGALALMTLENHIGWETMSGILESLITRHASSRLLMDDLLEAVLDGAGEAHASMAGELLREGSVVDFAVDEAACRPLKKSWGYRLPSTSGMQIEEHFDNTDGAGAMDFSELIRWESKPDEVETAVAAHWRWNVTVSNRGNVALPVAILLTFDGGRKESREWNGDGGSLHLHGEGAHRLLSATIDPENLFVLDSDRLNNSRSVKFQQNGVLYLASWTQFWLQNFLNGWAFFN